MMSQKKYEEQLWPQRYELAKMTNAETNQFVLNLLCMLPQVVCLDMFTVLICCFMFVWSWHEILTSPYSLSDPVRWMGKCSINFLVTVFAYRVSANFLA
jgi:hypothetical protein